VKHRICIFPMGAELGTDGDDDLLSVLREAGIGLESICGGMGTCGKCRVHIIEGRTNPPTAEEKESIPEERLAAGERLSCQVRPESDLSLYIPTSSLTHDQRLQLTSVLELAGLSPALALHDLEIQIPSGPGDRGSDLSRLLDAMENAKIAASPTRLDTIGLRSLPDVLRKGKGKIRVLTRNDELLGVTSPETAPLGLAVDLGSTKAALFVHDLCNGGEVAGRGFLNPQLSSGEDIISRINFALQGEENAALLSRLVVEEINRNLHDTLASVGLSPGDLYEMVLVGNTAMHHLFLGLSVEQLGKSPFLPVTDLPLEVKARELGLCLNPSAVLYLPPPIAGYVGSDHLAAIAASGLHVRPGPCLLLDVGTNTEVALQAGGHIRCCSCASGPAFEGGCLSQGMRAGEGAIEQVSIDPSTGEPEVSIIADADPRGICGSGALAALASLKDAGVTDASGRLLEEHKRVVHRDGELVYYLVSPGESNATGVALTQTDIREIQKAKGAIRAGIDALLEEAGISHADIREVILAGAFGSYIDPADALRVSMLPPVPLECVRQVGNAAGAGARSMLLDTRFRAEAEKLAERLEYLALSTHPGLSSLFASGMYLSEEAVYNARQRLKG
jgi:uncharacterized 2Fe-2S/4Fe-4S cluster protein (DUF4445 family)